MNQPVFHLMSMDFEGSLYLVFIAPLLQVSKANSLLMILLFFVVVLVLFLVIFLVLVIVIVRVLVLVVFVFVLVFVFVHFKKPRPGRLDFKGARQIRMDEKMVSLKNRLKYGVISYFNDPMNQSVQWSVIRFFHCSNCLPIFYFPKV